MRQRGNRAMSKQASKADVGEVTPEMAPDRDTEMVADAAKAMATGYALLAERPDVLEAWERSRAAMVGRMRRTMSGDAWADDAASDALEAIAVAMGMGVQVDSRLIGRECRRAASRYMHAAVGKASRDDNAHAEYDVDAERIEPDVLADGYVIGDPWQVGVTPMRDVLTYRAPSVPKSGATGPAMTDEMRKAKLADSGPMYGTVYDVRPALALWGMARLGMSDALRREAMSIVTAWAERMGHVRPMTRLEAMGPVVKSRTGTERRTLALPATFGTAGKRSARFTMGELDGARWPTMALAVDATRGMGAISATYVATRNSGDPTGGMAQVVPSAESAYWQNLHTLAAAKAYAECDPMADRYYRPVVRYRNRARRDDGTVVPRGTVKRGRAIDWQTWADRDGSVSRNGMRKRVATAVRPVRGMARDAVERVAANVAPPIRPYADSPAYVPMPLDSQTVSDWTPNGSCWHADPSAEPTVRVVDAVAMAVGVWTGTSAHAMRSVQLDALLALTGDAYGMAVAPYSATSAT